MGYVAEEEPGSEDAQQQCNDSDEQTFPGCGDCQQPVESFTLFLGFDNSIMK